MIPKKKVWGLSQIYKTCFLFEYKTIELMTVITMAVINFSHNS